MSDHSKHPVNISYLIRVAHLMHSRSCEAFGSLYGNSFADCFYQTARGPEGREMSQAGVGRVAQSSNDKFSHFSRPGLGPGAMQEALLLHSPSYWSASPGEECIGGKPSLATNNRHAVNCGRTVQLQTEG